MGYDALFYKATAIIYEDEFLELHKSELSKYTKEQKIDLKENPSDEFWNFQDRKNYLYQQIIDKCYGLIPELINQHGLNPNRKMIDQGVFVNVIIYMNKGVSTALVECLRDFSSFADKLQKDLFKTA